VDNELTYDMSSGHRAEPIEGSGVADVQAHDYSAFSDADLEAMFENMLSMNFYHRIPREECVQYLNELRGRGLLTRREYREMYPAAVATARTRNAEYRSAGYDPAQSKADRWAASAREHGHGLEQVKL
jgi:hypothetical protein